MKKTFSKRFISAVLALVLTLSMLPAGIFSFASYAAGGDGESHGAVTNAMLEALGFDTSDGQLIDAIEKAGDPFNGTTLSINTIPELMLTSNSLTDTKTYAWDQSSAFYGKRADDQANEFFLDESDHASPGIGDTTGYDNSKLGTYPVYSDNGLKMVAGATHFSDIAFDPYGMGKDNYVGRLYLLGTELYFRLIDANTGLIHYSFKLCDIPFSFMAHQKEGYLSMAAGDYDADGKDEIAVYIPMFNGIPQVVVYDVDASGMDWHTSYDLASICDLGYWYDYASYENGKYANHYSRWPIVDLTTIKASDKDADSTDDLVIAVSPSRNVHKYGAPSWNSGELLCTRLVVLTNPMIKVGTMTYNDRANFIRHFMRWSWSEYGSSSINRYETMLFGGVGSADVNGDGYDDIVVGGYRISNSHNSAGDGQADFDRDRMLVSYLLYDTDRCSYAERSQAEWVPVEDNIANGLNDNSNQVDNVRGPVAVAGFAEYGRGVADSLFINGTIARLEEVDMGHESLYAPDNAMKYATDTMCLISTYWVPIALWRDNAEGGGSHNNTWIGDVAVGNFNANDSGQEQIIFVIGAKTNSATTPDKATFTLGVMSLTNHNLTALDKPRYTDVRNCYYDYDTVYAYRRVTMLGTTAASSVCANTSLCMPDVDKDTVLMRYSGKSEYYFANPQVGAILQAAPYFGDVTVENDGYSVSGGTTSIGYSKSSSTGIEQSVTVSGGLKFGIGGGLDIIIFKAKAELEVEITASLGAGWASESTQTFSVEYSGASEDDHVVLMMSPYIRYHTQTYQPAMRTISSAYYIALRQRVAELADTIAARKEAYLNDSATEFGMDSYLNPYESYYETEADQALFNEYASKLKELQGWEDLIYSYRAEHGLQPGTSGWEDVWEKTVDARWVDSYIDVPQAPQLTMLSVTAYDRVANSNPDDIIEPVRGNVLNSTPGDPYSYQSYTGASLPEGWIGGTAVGIFNNTSWMSLSTGANMISQSIEYEKGTSKTVSWGAGVSVSGMTEAEVWCVGKAEIKGGFTAAAEYAGSYTWSGSEGFAMTGSVAGITENASALGYTFKWRLAAWKAPINGGYCTVVGYWLRDINSPPSAPQDLHEEEVTSDSITLAWGSGAIPGDKYQVYQVFPGGVYYHLGDTYETSYTDIGLQANTVYTYRVRTIKNSQTVGAERASVYSNSLTVQTNPLGQAPTIITQPANANVNPYGQASFSVTAAPAPSAGGNMQYQWQFSSGGSYANADSAIYSGANTSTLYISRVAADMNGYRYRCLVSQRVGGSAAVVYSLSATLNVGTGGSSISLALSASSGPAEASYTQYQTGTALVATPIRATIDSSAEEYSVVILGETLDTADYSTLYLRSYGESGTDAMYKVENTSSIIGATTALVALDSADVKPVTARDWLTDGDSIRIDADILDKTPDSGSGDIEIDGVTYLDVSPDDEINYYISYTLDNDTVYECFAVGQPAVYYTGTPGDYTELTRTTVYSVDSSEIPGFSPGMLLAYTRDLVQQVEVGQTVTQAGEEVTLTAQITPSNAAGNVSFLLSEPTSGWQKSVTVTPISGTATFRWTPTAAGTYSIIAYYGGGDTLPSQSGTETYFAYIGQGVAIDPGISPKTSYGSQITPQPKLNLYDSGNSSSFTSQSLSANAVLWGLQSSAGTLTSLSGQDFAQQLQQAKPGAYTVSASYTHSGVTYSAQQKVTVERAPLTVAAVDRSIDIADIATADLTANAGTVIISGAVLPDTAAALMSSFSLKCNMAQKIGSYGITVAYDQNDPALANYTVTTVPGKMTVIGAGLTSAAIPQITAQSVDTTAAVGAEVTLSVTATSPDGGTLSYQWYRDTDRDVSGGASLGSSARSATYKPSTSAAGDYYYYVVVTNTNSSADIPIATASSAAILVKVTGGDPGVDPGGDPGGNTGGSPGGTAPVATQTIPAQNGTVNVAAQISSATAVLSLTDDTINKIIAAGSMQGEALFDLTNVSGITKVTLPKAAVTALVGAGLDVAFMLPQGTVNLSEEAAASVAGRASGDSLTVELKRVEQGSLSKTQQSALQAGDIVYDISITSGNFKITSFSGVITVEIPYSGPRPVTVWHINGRGQLEAVACYDTGDTIVLSLDHLSLYVIRGEASQQVWLNPFADVQEGSWYYGDVEYVTENGLFSGTSATAFSPQTPMTRGMLVTVLGRLAGVDTADYTGSGFRDVASGMYYAPYTAWARELGIVSGVGDNAFAPDRQISRQDLAVILYRYSQIMGIALPASSGLASFADEEDIADYAVEAVAAIRQAGVVNGKPGNIFDPTGNATRAEVAAMLHRFAEMAK